jgi:hypothetical protein
MRFPRDKAETERMILTAIEGGVNFFDTAYIYPNSEVTLGKILAKHGKRRDVNIATKLPLVMCRSADDFDKYFNEQLRRLQTDYIDCYFLHNITDFAQWEHFKALGIIPWLEAAKKSGRIRTVGFSYHGTCGDFLRILDSYAWDTCMIQYNYYDENYQAGKTGLRAAAEKGVSVIIMEPLLGGRLAAGLPKKAERLFAAANPALGCPADWALWWLWNQSEVTVVLSGMSSDEIMRSNLRSADRFRPLTEPESAVYADVGEVFRKSYKINCTGCNYCLPCPVGINIPACFSAYNARYAQGLVTGMSLYFTSIGVLRKETLSPRRCNRCGRCEKVCPQNLPIRRDLRKVAAQLEPLILRPLIAVVRKAMT